MNPKKAGTVFGAPPPAKSRKMMVAPVIKDVEKKSVPLVTKTSVPNPVVMKPHLFLGEAGIKAARKMAEEIRGSFRGIGSYTPNNDQIFDYAYLGFLAGVYAGKDVSVVFTTDRTNIVSQAVIFAEAVDTLIASGSFSVGQAALVGSLSQSLMANKYGVGLAESSFTPVAEFVAGMFTQAQGNFQESDSGGVESVSVTLPLTSTGGANPVISVGPMTDQAFVDGTTIVPADLAGTTANVTGAFCEAFQTDSTTSFTFPIPLPGTSGFVPGSAGFIDVPSSGVLWLDVEIRAASTSTTDAAVWKMSWGWAVQEEDSPAALGTLITSVDQGTNGGAAPSGWSATIALDMDEQNALITFTGTDALTISGSIRGECGYTQ